jgi:hypothetical protein
MQSQQKIISPRPVHNTGMGRNIGRLSTTGYVSRVQSDKQGLWLHPIQFNGDGMDTLETRWPLCSTNPPYPQKATVRAPNVVNGIDSLLLSKWVSIDRKATQVDEIKEMQLSGWFTNERRDGWIDEDTVSVPLTYNLGSILSYRLVTSITDYNTDSKTLSGTSDNISYVLSWGLSLPITRTIRLIGNQLHTVLIWTILL